ncbi:Petal formation-expressed [Macleaya cordata]|uniref:Petal formation-expressed n=1 Tax=Macleaya cordata TaxID=56857 RepID=A0A200PYX3_MACCD|nr:Petal formation-expressed [Macleaya cordata]
MATLQVSNLLCSSSSSSLPLSRPRKGVQATIQVPKLKIQTPHYFNLPKLPITRNEPTTAINQQKELKTNNINYHSIRDDDRDETSNSTVTAELYMIMEAVAERVEMHTNIGEQRNNWNTLLLNSINAITITAATMTGLAASTGVIMGSSSSSALLALKLSSTLLYSAATGMLLVMNKIQPSQLAEEQRNAARLLKQLHEQIQTKLSLSTPTQMDVKQAMEKVLALDKAYPLPLLGGVMIEKFPNAVEPAIWWPQQQQQQQEQKKFINGKQQVEKNGWSSRLEKEMKDIVEVLKTKDIEEYVRLSKMVLKINKILAISGPLLTGIGALSSAFVGSSSHGSAAVLFGVVAGALATVVNTLEHGGQVGMVFEMYRACAGSFQLLEETIESTLKEREVEKRENGELFEMKVALQLGRSLSELRNLAAGSSSSSPKDVKDTTSIEFASKLF